MLIRKTAGKVNTDEVVEPAVRPNFEPRPFRVSRCLLDRILCRSSRGNIRQKIRLRVDQAAPRLAQARMALG